MVLFALALLTAVSYAADIKTPFACSPLPSSTDSSTASQFVSIEYDYLIIGGGNTGLPLADKLSQSGTLKVGVIEAGFYHQDDPLIDLPVNSNAFTVGNPKYDWNYQTIPQTGANGRPISAARGKMLGGSSGLNAITWNRPHNANYDAWASISGSSAWNWTGILPYMKEASYVVPQPNVSAFPGVSKSQSLVADAKFQTYEGTAGRINASLNTWYSSIVKPYVQSMNKAAIKTNAFPDDGSGNGIFNSRSAVDPALGIRSYAASSIYCPIANRQNLHVITGAQVTRLNLIKNTSSILARGATFVLSDGSTYAVNASKEVILATGAVGTPQILELSGIGNSSRLSQLGIQTVIDLPGVGENLQDQVFVPIQYQLTSNQTTFDELRINSSFALEQRAIYNQTRQGIYAATDSALAFLPYSAFDNKSRLNDLKGVFDSSVKSFGNVSNSQRKQFSILRKWIDSAIPTTEFLPFTKGIINPAANTSYLTVLASIQHPISRGNVHINSTKPTDAPVIDLGFLANDFDVQTLLDTVKFALRLQNVAPLSYNIANLTYPTPADLASDDALINYMRNTCGPGYHLSGTATLAPRADGGVVDANLRVYGTSNLRVADASMFPMIIASHLQETMYAIGEKAGDIILRGR